MEFDGEPDGEKDLGEELGDLVCGRSDHLSVPTEHTHTDSVSQSRAVLPKPVLDIQTLQGRVSSRTGLGSTVLENLG